MAYWRCVANIFGYCTGEPEWEIPPVDKTVQRQDGTIVAQIKTGGKCKLSPDSCGRFQTLEQYTISQVAKLPNKQQAAQDKRKHKKAIQLDFFNE